MCCLWERRSSEGEASVFRIVMFLGSRELLKKRRVSRLRLLGSAEIAEGRGFGFGFGDFEVFNNCMLPGSASIAHSQRACKCGRVRLLFNQLADSSGHLCHWCFLSLSNFLSARGLQTLYLAAHEISRAQKNILPKRFLVNCFTCPVLV
jgi:hypothetical protein